LVLLIGHAVDPSAKCIAIRLTELVPQAMSVLDLLNVPACCLELLLPLPGAHPGYHTIKGLSVEVDDPQDVAEPLGDRVSDRLPDVAFVELGVADDRYEAGWWPRAEMGVDVAAGHSCEERSGGTVSDRPGGEIDVEAVGILGAARICLETTEPSERRQLRPIEVAQEVLNGVEDR
jgi:hypothetical protein